MNPSSPFAAAAFCPHPPLLVPAVAAGEPVAVREPAVNAVRWLCRQPITQLLVVGGDERADGFGPGSAGDFAGYGVDFSVQLPGPGAAAGPRLPLPLAVGAWLLDAVGCGAPVLGATCDATGALPPLPSVEPGATGLLVMGDGTARRTEKAPGWLDERAAGYDREVSAALRSGDAAKLTVDLSLGAELLAAGAPVWTAAARLLAGTRWNAEVSYDDAPYGVGYLVARWWPADAH